MNAKDIRIAFEFWSTDDYGNEEKLYTHFVRPEKVADELKLVANTKYVYVKETYLADRYGQRL